MKPEIEEIVATLEMLTDGLYYSLVGDEPYEIITWEIEENKEFTFENLLKSIDAIVPVSFDDFLENTEQTQPLSLVQQYRNLANLLQSHLAIAAFIMFILWRSRSVLSCVSQPRKTGSHSVEPISKDRD